LYETRSWRQIAADGDYGGDSYWLAFAHDGRIATTSYDGKIRLYGTVLDGKRAVERPDGKRPFGIAFSPDGSRIAVGYLDATKVSVRTTASGQGASRRIPGIENGDVGSVAGRRMARRWRPAAGRPAGQCAAGAMAAERRRHLLAGHHGAVAAPRWPDGPGCGDPAWS
jgi:hypothetical protein